MATQIYVNLPVKDLNKSMSFFKSLGFGFNSEFTDETAACMVVSENIYVMLLTHEKFKEFTPKEICDATRCTEVLVGLSCEGRPNVDELVRKAVVAGEARTRTRKITDSCMDTDSRIWTATFGNSFTWSRCRLNRPRRAATQSSGQSQN